MLNDSILTWILFLPMLGALVLALLPSRGKLIQMWALLVSLATFGLTLHLPTHFNYGHR